MSIHEISKPYFPGFTRKSVSFSIDDGNFDLDKKFISIVAPYGIKGTFNLCSNTINEKNREQVRELYRGFEISNHCAHHPYCLEESMRELVSPDQFDRETADESKIYHHPTVENLYMLHKPKGWRTAAFLEDYVEFAKLGQRQLEEVFGEGNIKGFAWPFGLQEVPGIFERIRALGFLHIRIGGKTLDSTGYAIPSDLMYWNFTATGLTIKEQIPIYESYPDDGELKFFVIGAHSSDFVLYDNFCDLEYFSHTFGNKPDRYYTAGVEEIFHYSTCAKQLVITDEYIENPTDTDIYIKIDGEKIVLRAGTKTDLETKKIISKILI